MKLLLCSASPRRREYLERLGLRFEVAAPHIDETPRPGEQAADYVRRMAREKAQACALPGAVALAADTIVVAGRPEGGLGTQGARADAERMMRTLARLDLRVVNGV